ncbi:MAG: hypothetical protein JWM95_123 [Gemmatimonadetes bacterium]|nr:hypothetical protein [Gemmatimonadota bacterium]
MTSHSSVRNERGSPDSSIEVRMILSCSLRGNERWCAVYALAMASAFAPTCVSAQSAGREFRVPVTVAIVHDLPSSYSQYTAVIIRSSKADVGDVLIMPQAIATGTLLAQATHALLTARSIDGEHPKTLHGKAFNTSTLGVRGTASSLPLAPAEVNAAQRIVTYLLGPNAPMRSIVGIGDVPAVDMFPPRTPSRSRSTGL